MKNIRNLKINKTFLALGMALSIPFITSCGNNKDTEVEKTDESKTHTHLYVNFGDEVIAFKECEGYKLDINVGGYSGNMRFTVRDTEYNTLFSGTASNYTMLSTNDTYTDSIDEVLENVKVYTLHK